MGATAAAIEKFSSYLIGKDPFKIEDFNQNFLRSVYFRGSVIMSASFISPLKCSASALSFTTAIPAITSL